jgi:hypothetical protein
MKLKITALVEEEIEIPEAAMAHPLFQEGQALYRTDRACGRVTRNELNVRLTHAGRPAQSGAFLIGYLAEAGLPLLLSASSIEDANIELKEVLRIICSTHYRNEFEKRTGRSYED